MVEAGRSSSGTAVAVAGGARKQSGGGRRVGFRGRGVWKFPVIYSCVKWRGREGRFVPLNGSGLHNYFRSYVLDGPYVILRQAVCLYREKSDPNNLCILVSPTGMEPLVNDKTADSQKNF